MADAEIKSEAEAIEGGSTEVELWLKKIERVKSDFKAWNESAKQACKVYEAGQDKDAETSFNILHANVETMVPALYNSTPTPDIRRRFNDKDMVAKQGVDIIERAVSYSIDQYDFDGTMTEAVKDSELAGRGIARVRYEPKLVQKETQHQAQNEAYEDVGYQEVSCEPVTWDKWGHGPAKCWERVPFVYFEHDLTEEDLLKLGVSPAIAKDLPFDDSSTSSSDTGGSKKDRDDADKGIIKTVKTYEVWDKEKGEVLFVTAGHKQAAVVRAPDPLGIPGFFPVPKPIQPLKKRKTMVPIVPYKVYQTQVEELEQITKRIASLISQLRVRGLFGGEDADKNLELIKNLQDGEYAPVENGAGWSGAGGIEKMIAHWPMDPTVKALQQLYIQREAVKQTIYEISAVSDILRGATDAQETATAQNIKAQWGSQRIQRRQAEVARFARDLFRMKAAIICGKFSTENIKAMTQLEMPPEVEQIIRNDVMRAYRIDIESDSTIRADMARTQEQMNQFLASTAQYTQAMAAILETFPESMPAMTEIYTSFARRFKLGKQAEDALEGLSQIAQQKAQAAQEQQGQPDPEMQKAQMDMQILQQKAQLDTQVAQQKMQMEGMSLQAKAQHEERMAQLAEKNAELDIQIKMIELQIKQQGAQLDAQVKMQDAQLRTQERQQDHEYNTAEREQDMQMQREGNDIKRESMADKAKFDKQRMAQQAKAKPTNGART